jgi:hypothetical protein
MLSLNQSAEIVSATVQNARAIAYPVLQPGLATFVAEVHVCGESPRDPDNGEPDVWELREAADRRELLGELHTMFQAGYTEPVSEFELIGVVWLYVVNRCDSPLLIAAENLWLEFEGWLPGYTRRRTCASTI